MDNKNEKKISLIKLFLILTLFGIGFGYIEGTVAHYLRIHYYPEGVDFTLKVIDNSTIIIEMVREFATLLVLFTFSYLSSNIIFIKLSNFIYIFSIWDIVYYFTLYFIEKWPDSILAWDVLFLIPVTWFSPVISPIIISILGIIGVLSVHYIYKKNNEIKISVSFILMILISLVLWFISFVNYNSFEKFPEKYNWFLFIAGIIICLINYCNLFFINKYHKINFHLKKIQIK